MGFEYVHMSDCSTLHAIKQSSSKPQDADTVYISILSLKTLTQYTVIKA